LYVLLYTHSHPVCATAKRHYVHKPLSAQGPVYSNSNLCYITHIDAAATAAPAAEQRRGGEEGQPTDSKSWRKRWERSSEGRKVERLEEERMKARVEDKKG
jgi:hypothetical protein